MSEDFSEQMRAREIELINQIEEMRRDFMKRAEPLARELGDIRMCRGPDPVVTDDGRVLHYVGPLPRWTPTGIDYSTVSNGKHTGDDRSNGRNATHPHARQG